MGRMGKSTKTFLFCSFCQFANFTISFCQQNGQNRKIDIDIFNFAHSASLLTLPFHSASRMGRIGKSTKTFSFSSFCQFANFTISFCQQNGKIDKDIFHSAHSAILLTSAHSANLLILPFHSPHSASLLTLPFRSAHSASLLTLLRHCATRYVTQANRNITCSYLNVLNCIERYVNDKDRNRTKQYVRNSIDPQQMLDRGMIRLDTFLYRLDTDRFE